MIRHVESCLTFKGLIIPGHILLSDKKQPWGNTTKTHEGALLPRMFWSLFREGFCQTAIYDREWLIPIMTYLLTIIFLIIYYEIFWFHLKKCLAFPHLGQSRWEDKVTVPKIKGSSTRRPSEKTRRPSEKTRRPSERVFMSGLIMLISIVFLCVTGNDYDISVYNRRLHGFPI